jgi:hypothetical protein
MFGLILLESFIGLFKMLFVILGFLGFLLGDSIFVGFDLMGGREDLLVYFLSEGLIVLFLSAEQVHLILRLFD